MKETNYTPSLWYCDMQLLSICINLGIPGSSHLSSRPIPSPQSSWKAFWKTCATLPYHGRAQLFGTFPRSNLCVRMVSFSSWSIVHLVRNISHPSVSIDILQDISLFSQLHRNQYPEILGIMVWSSSGYVHIDGENGNLWGHVWPSLAWCTSSL